MQVIDADSHFLEPPDWIEKTDPALARMVPKGLTPTEFSDVMSAELLAAVPERQRPAPAPPRRQPSEGGTPEERDVGVRPALPAGGHDPVARIAFCDQHGIDIQLIGPTFLLGTVVLVERQRPDLRRRVIEAYNSWAAGTVEGYTERLVPVTCLDLADPEWAVGELTRMRRAGSRAFVFQLEPVDGRSLSDPDFDQVWAAAVTLGMIPILHVGFGRVRVDPTWATVGGRVSPSILARMVLTQTQQIAQLALANMIYGGVFDRHPGLTVVCQEFGLAWVASWIDRIGPVTRDGRPTALAGLGWSLQRTPEEYLARNIRFSPLCGQRVDKFIDEVGPGLVVFATDYPHPEGSVTAFEEFTEQLASDRFDDRTRAGFFGGTMEELLRPGR